MKIRKVMPVRPNPEQLSHLEPFERFAFGISDAMNRNPLLKRAGHTFLRTFGATWVHVCTRNLLTVEGLEPLASLRPPGGVVLACNHRSFFDLYVISSVLLRKTDWIRGMYFPVRSNYWYERPDGIIVNGIMSAWAMYPPVLRDPRRKSFNEYTVDFLADVMTQPGAVLGIHPEGTRNKTDDPYTLVAAHPGIGQIVRRSNPLVIPAFILGLSNDIARQVRGNFDGTGERIQIVFGAPMDFTAMQSAPAKLRTYKTIADRVKDEIQRLGTIERAMRERR